MACLKGGIIQNLITENLRIKGRSLGRGLQNIKDNMACKIDCEGNDICFGELVQIADAARCNGFQGCYDECPEGTKSYGKGILN